MNESTPRPLRVFMSYAPEDRELARALAKHLDPLKHRGRIEYLSADQVAPGADYNREIMAILSRIDAVVVLLSPDFMASKYLQDAETVHIFERCAVEGTTIVPVLLRSCIWDEAPELSGIRILPTSGKAVASYEGDARDEVMADIAKFIARLASESHVNRRAVAEKENPSSPGGLTYALARSSMFLFPFLARSARAYMKEAKESEAKNTIGAMTRAIAAYMEREDLFQHRQRCFPSSAPRTPQNVPRATKFFPDEETWNHPTWRAIHFSMTQPMYHSYEIETSPDRRAATVRAYGDLDGRGVVTILERHMALNENDEVLIFPELTIREEPG